MIALPRQRVSNGTVGMLLLLATETMFFCGLISAYLVARAHAPLAWPPEGQPRLPVASTAANTAVLLISAVVLIAGLRRGGDARRVLGGTALLGTAFLALQGREWARLLGFGLTTTSSLYGAFFYTIVGAHALHALAGLALLAWVQARRGDEGLRVASLYWLFVVGLWPFIYGLVYLL